MKGFRVSRTRLLVAACALVCPAHRRRGGLGADRGPAQTLTFTSCGLTPQAASTECATADLPLDYDRPDGARCTSRSRACPRGPATGIGVAVLQLRRPRRRSGRLPPGVGATGSGTRSTSTSTSSASTRAASARARRRSTATSTRRRTASTRSRSRRRSTSTSDALLAQGQALHPAPACGTTASILSHVSTANVARDMDAIRPLLGERKLNYFGYSYGTFLGATYANLFPNNYRAMVLDGPIDATAYINKPWRDLAEQSAAFERALSRFFQACAADQAACSGFGGSDPWDAYDQLVERRTRTRSRRRLHGRPAAGRRRRHQLRRRRRALREGALGRARPGARDGPGRRRLAHPRARRRRLRPQRRRHATARARPVLHDRRDRAALPA